MLEPLADTGFLVRPDTEDACVWAEVFRDNVYQLPDDMSRWHVIDIGAHIGAFSVACAVRGVAWVAAFEPDRKNYSVLCRNWALFGIQGSIAKAAMWRSDGWKGPLGLSANTESRRTAGRSVALWDGTELVPSFPLDDVLEDRGPIDLLKLDCEGSEFAILYTSKHLDQVQRIVAETHTYPADEWRPEGVIEGHANTADALANYLADQGFSVETRPFPQPGNEVLGFLSAWRRA